MIRRAFAIILALAVAAALASFAGSAAAQGTARSLDIDTSVRSLGRGSASNAFFWDGGNEWANPALLGYRHGFSVTWDHQDFVPDLADHVFMSSRRVSLGLWGVGFSTAGQPVDVIGGSDLEYGRSESTDIFGNPVPGPVSFEHTRSWSFGASLASVFDEMSARFGRHSSMSDWADVAVGGSQKRLALAFSAPVTYVANATDFGLFARISPIDTRRSEPGDAIATHRLDVGYGHSVINANDAFIDFVGFSGPSPLSRTKRDGVALGWTMRAPAEAVESDRYLWRILGPDHALLRAVLAFDSEHVSAGDDETYAYDVERWGAELSAGRVFAVRVGHVLDREGDIDGYSLGFGLGAPLGPLAELAYDFASIPQAEGMDNRYAHSLTFRLDVLGTLRHWREEAPDAATN